MSSENLVCKITPGGLNTFPRVPTSKSFCNRALILSALAGNKTLHHLASSTDVKSLIAAFKTIGLKLNEEGDKLTVVSSFPECELNAIKPIELSTGDGGTTNRFLLAMLATGKNRYHIRASKEMLARPMSELFEALHALGVKAGIENDYFYVQGPLNLDLVKDKTLEVESKRSSQFYTAVKLLTVKYNFKVSAVNLENSVIYARMTDHLITKFQNKSDIEIPVDFSSLGYPIALSLFTNAFIDKRYTEIDEDQADSNLISIVNSSGGKISLNENGLSVIPTVLKPFTADASIYPDLIPTLAFIAAHIAGESHFKNLEILRHKESDRVKELLNILDLAKVNYQYSKDHEDLRIFGRVEAGAYPSFEYYAPNDHRMIMVAALFMRKNYGGVIYNAQHVKKSFANFFDFLA